ncbi:Piezo-type mechanosensitive ion channel component 2 [Frankliniella fusca]|uniref:Piezo-type mechanosensitive ion channel component 2 n=1 Tax=Frankliniella fusca TaxID=407009 RepID=A0AAE1LC23_9NEOP|nr:Piezo-type mechanosensitive ion channel component 2 [Frankliniella fusca]
MMGMISASSSCAFLISFGLNQSGMTLVQLTSTVSFVILITVCTFLPNPASPLEVAHSPQLLEDLEWC